MTVFTTEYRYADYLHANRLYLLRQWLTWRSAVLLTIMFGAVTFLKLNSHEGTLPWRIGASALHALPYFLGAGALLALGFFHSLPAQAQTQWRKKGLTGTAATYDLQLDGFSVASPSMDLRLKWNDFDWWTEDHRLFLAKVEACPTMIWLPKDQVEDEVLDRIRDGLARCKVRRI